MKSSAAQENTSDLWREHLAPPATDGHKYDRGHAIVLSGGPSSTGAARLAAGAALRVGAGLVTLASPAAALMVNACHLTAVMLARANDSDELAELLADKRITSVVAGPGMGLGKATVEKVSTLLASRISLVLDADALTSFADDRESFFGGLKSHGKAVLTPHAGEFARLFPGLHSTSGSRQESAIRASQTSGAVVVLKGAESLIAAPDGRCVVNRHASPWLATAGSGDVLAGTIGGLLAQGLAPFEAACAGVWLHGDAGIKCGAALTAEDLDWGLREALAELYRQY